MVLQRGAPVTEEELVELAHEVDQLLSRWRERTLGRGDGRATYSVYQLIQPYPDLPAAEAPDDT